MFRHLSAATVLTLACGSALPAMAQDFIAERAVRPGQMQTVQSTFNASMPLDGTADIATQQLESLRTFYKMAAGSCAEVLATIADNCEIVRLTTGVTIRETAPRGPQLTINGTVVMKVDFRKAAAKPAE